MFKTREDEIEFTLNKDPDLKEDTILEMGDNKFTYGELLERHPIKTQDPNRSLIYWDDVCQYTSIGLIEIINSLCKTNAKIDLEHFFTRPNDYIYGISYVYKLYEGTIDKSTIDMIKRKYYWKIMMISLKSTVLQALLQTNSFYQSIGFFFPYRFDNCDKLQAEFKDIFFKDKPFENLKFYYGMEGKRSFNQILYEDNYNSVITPNIVSVYESILDKKMKRISILGPVDHNGITEELKDIFIKLEGLPLPNYCKINLYTEQIMAPKQ